MAGGRQVAPPAGRLNGPTNKKEARSAMNKLPVIDTKGLLDDVDAWCARVGEVKQYADDLVRDVAAAQRRTGGAR